MERTIKTRVKDGAEPVETKIVLDFSGCSREDLEDLASKTEIIRKQGEWRKAGSIPTSCTVDVKADLDAPRASRGPVDPKVTLQKFLATLDPEAKKAWIAEQLGEE